MAWDFETDPDFAEKLSWMRNFIDSEVIPLEPILAEIPTGGVESGEASSAGQGEGAGAMGAVPRPKPGW